MRASATMAMRRNSSLAGADPRLKPAAQRRSRLVAQPEPGKLNHGVPQATIARLGDALIPFDAAALPGLGADPAYAATWRRLTKLRNNDSSRRSDANSGPMPLSLRSWAAGLFRSSASVRMSASRARSTAASCVVTTAIRSSSRRISAFSIGGRFTAVAGSQRLEPFETISPKRIVIPDALAAEQAPNSIGMLNTFLEQRAALARQAPAILFFRARRANHGTDPPLAVSPGHQRPQQRLAVDRIGLRPPMPPVDRDRSRINDLALDPIGEQQDDESKTRPIPLPE